MQRQCHAFPVPGRARDQAARAGQDRHALKTRPAQESCPEHNRKRWLLLTPLSQDAGLSDQDAIQLLTRRRSWSSLVRDQSFRVHALATGLQLCAVRCPHGQDRVHVPVWSTDSQLVATAASLHGSTTIAVFVAASQSTAELDVGPQLLPGRMVQCP